MVSIPTILQDSDGIDYHEGMQERMYLLAAGLSAPTIVEIGTRTGNSLRIWMAAVASNGGTVYTIDVTLSKLSWPIPSGCVYIVNSSHLVEWWNVPIDLLYIDSDHTQAGCQRDVDVWWPRLRAGGHLLVHDITNVGHYGDLIPVVATLARANSIAWEIWPNQCGMAHLIKPDQVD